MTGGLDTPSAHALAAVENWRKLASQAAALRDVGWGPRISYSRKVFVPLTQLCRDVCHYCTFAKTPRRLGTPYVSIAQAVAIAREGAAAGCKEVLFTLGDKPELRYPAARSALAALGHDSTIAYLAEVARTVQAETGLLPHFNPGVLSPEDIALLRPLGPSMGIMLESVSQRLCEADGAHHGSPDKDPAARIATIRAAGAARVPLTTGLLIGIGETRRERIETLLAIRDLHAEYGHIQEVIVQNFRAKPDTRMAYAAEPTQEDLCWTIAAARLILGAGMSIQAPPNLCPGDPIDLIEAGINDWGGISPITPDHVNPEAAWPHLDDLAADTRDAGYDLVERLTVYPDYIHAADRWIDPGLHMAVQRASDGQGWARVGRWSAGLADAVGPDDRADTLFPAPGLAGARFNIARIVDRAMAGHAIDSAGVVALFEARGEDFAAVVGAADARRRELVGDTVSYVVTRNINYTNICLYRCGFCAFSKGKTHDALRGKPYLIDRAEITRRTTEAWERGATEVCMQGGIHPAFDGHVYLDALAAAKAGAPHIHVHAFSPLEVTHGAQTLGLSITEFLAELKGRGLGSLPGTAAEILDDGVRRIICPDKLMTDEWLDVIAAAHRVGLKTTATIMFGHVDRYEHWATHLLRLRALQEATGGITEFVPLPFVHMEAPIYLKGQARKGPTLRETILMHAVARLVFGALIPNIQVSWVKLGPEQAARCLAAGVNDMGGTLMDETISRSAGAAHGPEFDADRMEALIRAAGRTPRQRTTSYGDVPIRELIAAE